MSLVVAPVVPQPSSHVQVAIRLRPHQDDYILKVPQHPVLVIPDKKKQYTYDHVFDDTNTNEDVFGPVMPLVQSFLLGYNATVFAYGQTGSGKSYSMGSDGENDDGIIPLALNMIFERAASQFQHEYSCHVTFCEIYGDDVRDLFSKQVLTKVTDQLTKQKVTSADKARHYLQKGLLHRTTAKTKMNSTSSRSHAIFTVELHQVVSPTQKLSSKFHFVDLAGSERPKKTLAEGLRFKEGININKGLLALGNVMNALSEKKPYVPYRSSKLTRMLQDALGGNSQTLMLACVSPAKANLNESLNSLEYAQRTRKICNNALVNAQIERPSIPPLIQSELEKLRAEIARLMVENKNLQDCVANLTVYRNQKPTQQYIWQSEEVRSIVQATSTILCDIVLQGTIYLERLGVHACITVTRHPRTKKFRQAMQSHPMGVFVANLGFVLSCSFIYCVDIVCPNLL